MNKKSSNTLNNSELTEILETFIKHIDRRFDGVEQKLDRIESKVTGLSGRVEVLEDTIRMMKTKLGIR